MSTRDYSSFQKKLLNVDQTIRLLKNQSINLNINECTHNGIKWIYCKKSNIRNKSLNFNVIKFDKNSLNQLKSKIVKSDIIFHLAEKIDLKEIKIFIKIIII